MDVLVYNGPGVSQTALTHTLNSLKHLLVPNYTVSPITSTQLASDPWSKNCALLVIPGGRDVPYHNALKGPANQRIKDYVTKQGGRFLGVGAGAYYASKRVEWEAGNPSVAIVGDRELAFFPGTCKGNVYDGFVADREEGGKAIPIELDEGEEKERQTFNGIYYNGGGYFQDAEDIGMALKGVRVLARYVEGEGGGKAAAVACRPGGAGGQVVLWGAHLEYPVDKEPALAALAKLSDGKADPDAIAAMEKARWALLVHTLGTLGLVINSTTDPTPSSTTPGPLPQILVASRSGIVKRIMKGLESEFKQPTTDSQRRAIEDANDTLCFYPSISLHPLLQTKRQQPDFLTAPKIVTVFDDEDGYPPESDTPKFNLRKFFGHLGHVFDQLGVPPTSTWGMGEALLYGEIVTSTQTMFDKNPNFMHALPTPILSIASQQLSGRGRGANVWLSPAGCLQFSLLLRPPAGLPPGSIVFIQYLFGLAVVEACRKVMPKKAGDKVRLKWPNDIYALVGDEKKKLGGILVNTSWSGGKVDIVIGCGINVLNPLPTTSLSHLMPPADAARLTLEDVAATIMPVFEKMWNQFTQGGGSFAPFMDLYLERWLHSDQLVTLTTTTPHTKVRIAGITAEHGLLRTVPERSPYGGERGGSEAFIDLQPDGNSFDMMEGLIRVKQ